MKKLKRSLALLLALVMAFSLLSVNAWADEEDAEDGPASQMDVEVEVVEDDDAEAYVEDEDTASLMAASAITFEDGEGNVTGYTEMPIPFPASGTYTLNADITVPRNLYNNSTDMEVTIDLNGYDLTSNSASVAYFASNASLVGDGVKFSIVNSGDTESTFNIPSATTPFYFGPNVKNSTITVGEGVTIKADNVAGDGCIFYMVGNGNKVVMDEGSAIDAVNGYGIAVMGTGNSADVAGTIKAGTPVGTNGSGTHSGTIDIRGTAVLTSVDNKSHGMYLPGDAVTTIEDGAEISGCDAIYTKSGTLTIEGGTFRAALERTEYSYYGNGGNPTGDTIVIDNCSYPSGFATVAIRGGTFISAHASAVGSYAFNPKATDNNAPVAKFITGGTFISGGDAPVFNTDKEMGVVEDDISLLADGYSLLSTGEVVKDLNDEATEHSVVEWTKADESVVYLNAFPATLTEGAYKLVKDVTVSEVITTGDVTVDFNGKTLSTTSTGKIFTIGKDVNNTTATFTDTSGEKGGTLSAAGTYASIASFSDGNTINIEAGVVVDGCVYFLGDGNTVNVRGTVNGHNDYGITTNGSSTKNGKINIFEGAVVTADDDNNAMYIPAGTVTIKGGTFTGGNAILMKSGTLTIEGGTFTGTKTPPQTYTHNNNGFEDTTGEAILIDNCGYPDGAPVVSITGGTFISNASSAVRTVGSEGQDRQTGIITGGTFTSASAYPMETDLLADGYAMRNSGVVYKADKVAEYKASAEAAAEDLIEFPTVLKSGAYKLTADAVVDESIYLEAEDTNVTIDLNGKTLTSTTDGRVLFVSPASLKSNGVVLSIVNTADEEGVLDAPNAARVMQFGDGDNVNDAKVTLGAGVTIKTENIANNGSIISVCGTGNGNLFTMEEGAVIDSTDGYGVVMWDTSNELVIAGTIKAGTPVGTNGSGTPGGKITIKSTAKLESVTDDHAMYLPGGQTVTIENGATLTGGDAIYVKGGSLTIEGGSFTATHQLADYEFYGNGGISTGDTIVVDNCNYPSDFGSLEIKGGTFTSSCGRAVGSYFSQTQTEPLTGFITGGTFNGAVTMDAALIAEGYILNSANTVIPKVEGIVSAEDNDEIEVADDAVTAYSVPKSDSTEEAVTVQIKTDTTEGQEEKQVDVAATVDTDNLVAALASEGAFNEATDDTEVQISMSAGPSPANIDAFTDSTDVPGAYEADVEVHPVFKVGSGEAKQLDNQFIKNPMKVVLKNFVPAGYVLTMLKHWLTDTTFETITAFDTNANGDVIFYSDTFSKFTGVIEENKDNAGKQLHQYALSLVEDTAHSDVDGDGAKEYLTGSVTYKIMLETDEENNVNALDFTVKGTAYMSDIAVVIKGETLTGIGSIDTGIKYAFDHDSETDPTNIEAKTEPTQIGTITFTLSGSPDVNQTIQLTDATVKERIVDRAIDANLDEAKAKIEVDPEYTITIQNPAVYTSADAGKRAGAINAAADPTVTTYQYTILTGLKTTADMTAIVEPTLARYDFDYYKKISGNSTWSDIRDVTEGDTTTKATDVLNSYVTTAGTAPRYGNVTLLAEYTTKKYTLTVMNPKAPTEADHFCITAYTSTSDKWEATTYKYDIEGKLYNADGTATVEKLAACPVAYYEQAAYKVPGPVAGANWTTSDTVAKEATATPDGKYGDITLYADYEAIEYTITMKEYDVNSTTKVIDKTAELVAADTASMKYTIEGKTTKNGAANATIPTATKTYYDDAVQYDLIEQAEGGNWGTVDTTQVNVGAVGTGKHGNITLRAVFTATEYDVTYGYANDNGVATGTAGTGDDANPATYTIEDATNTGISFFGKASCDGYEFLGWSSDIWTESGEKGVLVDTDLDGGHGDVTLKAVWGLKGTYKAVDYKYAKTGDKLILFAVKKVDVKDTGAYTYDGYPMYVVADGKYNSVLTSDTSGDEYPATAADADYTVFAYIAAGDYTKVAFDMNKAPAVNEAVAYDGDVTGNGKVNSGDYGDVSALLLNRDLYNDAQLGVLGRLEADVAVKSDGGESELGFATIADVRDIMNIYLNGTGT